MLLKDMGINTRTVNALANKDINTLKDMVEYKPRRYYFFKNPIGIDSFSDGVYMAVKAKQLEVDKRTSNKGGKKYLYFKLQDLENGQTFTALMFCNVFKFPQYYQNNNKDMVFCGKLKFDDYFGWSVVNIIDMIPLNQYKPFFKAEYSNIKGVSDANFNKILNDSLNLISKKDFLDKKILKEANLVDYKTAILGMHYPKNIQDIKNAKYRLIFDDLLFFNIMMQKNNESFSKETTLNLKNDNKTDDFLNTLDFALTDGEGSQKEVIDYIINNSKNNIRNDILLQGDVGCGKTIVAIACMMFAAENGYQSILMTPREILAKQHYREVKEYADKLGIKTVFLYSGLKAKEKKDIYKSIKNGETMFIIGTHSCISKDVEYKNLGFVITDEEHLFGVAQKDELLLKSKEGVNALSMSATPIPRTLANVLYGDQKEIKIISKKPNGRLPILTKASANRQSTMKLMLGEIQKGRQCYVVCPAIENNDKVELISIEKVYREYKNFFDQFNIKVGVVNGKMKSEEIKKTTDAFVKNKIQILISTTVIEVGVNVPNATVMTIEQSERFGLASLHQLRGRVGRGKYQSYCVLLSNNVNNERIKIMCDTNDGFKIAEFDLEQRRSGDLIGTEQSGINKYVEEMLQHPKTYDLAKKISSKLSSTELKGIISWF